MQTPDDFVPPEVIDLEEEADARGYFASDDDPGEDAIGAARDPATVVRSERR